MRGNKTKVNLQDTKIRELCVPNGSLKQIGKDIFEDSPVFLINVNKLGYSVLGLGEGNFNRRVIDWADGDSVNQRELVPSTQY